VKKIAILLSLALLVFLLVPAALAAPASYTSGFQIQNLSGTAATVQITYYNRADGSVHNTVSDTIPANGSKTYFPLGAVTAGFDGSVVISSDQPVAAIANVLAEGGSFAGMGGASYGGFSTGSQSVSLPLIMRNNSGFNTWFNVQNAGTAATTVTVSYANAPTCNQTATIQPGAAARFDQTTHACLGATYVGAATVQAGAGGSIVASGIQTGATTLFAYNAFTGGPATPLMPLINANNSGYITGVQLQNAGNASTSVTISYTPVPGAGTACTETATIAAGESVTYALYAFTFTGGSTSSNCTRGERFVGSATVSANSASQPLVAVVNQLNLSDNKGSAYNSFDPAEASQTVVMPLIMDRNSGFYTGFNVMNVGSSTTVTCNFAGTAAGSPVTGSVTSPTLGTGAAFNHLQLNFLANGFVGSATCNATAGGQIIGVVNELAAGVGDLLLTYEAFNN
jgi:hypothetical protein